MDRWGPGFDCQVCGQPNSNIDARHCGECEKDICDKCIEGHDCKPLEDFLKKLSSPLAEALGQFDYYFAAESVTDTERIFEFLSADNPRIEVRIER